MIIRPALPAEDRAIAALTKTAFAPMRFSDGTEASIPRALRLAGDLTLSLVAEEDGELHAHVAFSPVRIADGTADWFALGPISVAPADQKKGLGKRLISSGLQRLRDIGAAGCLLTGNPAVYGSSGFASIGKLTHGATLAANILSLRFHGPEPLGEVDFAPAFDGS